MTQYLKILLERCFGRVLLTRLMFELQIVSNVGRALGAKSRRTLDGPIILVCGTIYPGAVFGK